MYGQEISQPDTTDQTNKSVIEAKQAAFNEVYVFSIKYRYSDILMKNHNFICSVDKTFGVVRRMDVSMT